MRLETRNTPLGRVLVAVDPDQPAREPRIVGVAPDPDVPPDDAGAAHDVTQEDVVDAFRGALRRIASRFAPAPDPARVQRSREVNDLLDRTNAVVEEMLTAYLQRAGQPPRDVTVTVEPVSPDVVPAARADASPTPPETVSADAPIAPETAPAPVAPTEETATHE